jgi:predicted permease
MRDDPRWQRYWRYLSARFRPEIEEELALHVELRARTLEAEGLSPEEARREARRRFGDPERIKGRLERLERRRGLRLSFRLWLEESIHDLRYGARALYKRPGFTLLTACSLAVGITAATVVLSVIDSWLLRPLPVKDAASLVVIGASTKATGGLTGRLVSQPTVQDLQARTDLLEGVASIQIALAGVRRQDGTVGERRLFFATTGNFFSSLGVGAELGRTITPEDEARREPVVVLTHRAWVTRFGGDPAVIGRTIYLNQAAMTIVGVARKGFAGTDHLLEPDGFVPVSTVETFDPGSKGMMNHREFGTSTVIAHLRPGVSLERLNAALAIMSDQIREAYPAVGEGYRLRAYPETRARPTLEGAELIGTIQLAFGGLALLVLLTACVNATNLLLAQGSTRRPELVVRQALGASRGRVLRQLLTQNVLLACLALAIASAGAAAAIEWFGRTAFTAGDLPISWGVRFDGRVFAMAAGVALAAGLVAGLGPALVASRFDLQTGIREASRGGVSRRAERVRGALVVAQVAASLVVLISAGLLTTSVRRAAAIDVGFQPEGILTAGVDAGQIGLDPIRALALFRRIELEAERIPGVSAVAFSGGVPLSASTNLTLYDVVPDGAQASSTKAGTLSMLGSSVDPRYFETLRLPVLEGRTFTDRDTTPGRRVIVLNRRAAELLWPGKSALGRVVRLGRDSGLAEVVGVVKNSKYILIGEGPRPFFYLSMAQQPLSTSYLYLRTSGDPTAVIGAMREAVARVDAGLSPFEITPLERLIQHGPNGLGPLRLGSTFATGIAIMAIGLTLLGLYGVIAYSVVQRTREIGLRMALGANRWSVARSVFVRGAWLLGLGLVIGTATALALTRQMVSILVGVSATELSVFLGAVILLTTVAIGSIYLPARRASGVDPMTALRSEG